MTRKKRPFVPPRPAPPQSAAPGEANRNPAINRAVSIDRDATTGRSDIRAGQRVQITAGLYEGAAGTVESIVAGVIPAAVVRTSDGKSRRVRTIDLIPET